LSSDPDYCNYQHQPDTIATILGIQDHQAPSCVCDDKGCDYEHQNNRQVPIFGKEAYKIITTLEDTSLQLGGEFSVFTVFYSCQPSQAALEEVQKNICKLRKIVEQLKKLFKRINESNNDQETKEAYEYVYTSVSKKYFSHIQ
jgi:hypothetical protein